MAKIDIVNADILDWAKKYKGKPFMALFCDAPYSLGDGKKGFMGKEWDNNIACNPDTWRALAEHLLPGAFLFVFAGTLNDDLISVAMRQAGLRKFHKACLWWSYGSGFPKSSRIDTAIDRAEKVERKFVGISPNSRFNKNKMYANGNGLRGHSTYKGDKITTPATPLAKTWAGHRYGLQSLKPSAETILIFMKPYEKGMKPVESITGNGSGALWIDGARIDTKPRTTHKDGNRNGFYSGEKKFGQIIEGAKYNSSEGRWPANLLLQHSKNDNGVCSPECPIKILDDLTGKLRYNKKTGEIKFFSASNFFFQADWNHEATERIEQAAAVRYQAKANRRERDAGLDDLSKRTKRIYGDGIISADHPEKANGGGNRECKNHHPTVKPISLCKYLATLLLPPVEYAPRRILIPFSGSGSEGIGAMLAGFEEITMIEKEKEYCDIGAARVKYWQNHKEPASKKSKPKIEKESAQLELV